MALAIQTVNAIAAALEKLTEQKGKKGKDVFNEKANKLVGLKNLLRTTLLKAQSNELVDAVPEGEEELGKKETSRDLGCLAGLLLAGIQRYVCKAKGDAAKKKELCDLFIDASAGFLTGVPAGGFVFGPVGDILKYASHRWYHDDIEGVLDRISRAVRQHFDEYIAAPIFFDGQYVSKLQEGKKEEKVIKVDWDEFSKWYDQIISWNEMQNEMIVWERRMDKKKAKEEEKKKSRGW